MASILEAPGMRGCVARGATSRRRSTVTVTVVYSCCRSKRMPLIASDRVPWLSFSRDVPRVVSSVH